MDVFIIDIRMPKAANALGTGSERDKRNGNQSGKKVDAPGDLRPERA